MIYKIKYWPDTFLKKVANEVSEYDLTQISDVVDNLFETMVAGRGMGLAATQCGIDMRIFVIDTEQIGGKLKQAFINPVVKAKTEKLVVSEEGCLSFPGVFAPVQRFEGLVVESTTLTGETKEAILNGVDAICFQHELDHLNGVVFFDHLGNAKRQMLETQVRKRTKKLERLRKRK